MAQFYITRGFYVESLQCNSSLYALYAALFHHFKDPLMVVEGKMQYLYDETGRRYLDVRPRTQLFPGMYTAKIPNVMSEGCSTQW